MSHPRFKILSHWSEEKFNFNPGQEYSGRFPNMPLYKPHGLWLSDDSDYGWKKWCKDEDFYPERLTFRADFKVDLSQILHLSDDQMILGFSREFLVDLFPDEPSLRNNSFLKTIDWKRVRELGFKGLLISPYSWEMRLHEETSWYSSWDCASACIWDVSCLEQIGSFEEVEGIFHGEHQRIDGTD